MQSVLMRWQASSFFGWGILGLNLFEHWMRVKVPDMTYDLWIGMGRRSVASE